METQNKTNSAWNRIHWKRFKWAGHRQTDPRLFLWSIVTAWLCFFFTFTTITANAGTTTGSRVNIIQQSVTASTATTTINSPNVNAKPDVFYCIFWWIFWILVVAGIILGALWLLCRAAHLCGNAGNQPPQAPNNGNGDNLISKGALLKANALINTNVPLPTTVFYYSGGILVSNSAGLPNSTMPAFLTVNGQPLPFGGQIENATPGISTPPSIGVWTETNTFFDETLDPTYPYVAIYNFSVLTTTNLLTGWNELCTIVGWVNENPSVPLACYVTYTNNVPMATNWAQCYINKYMQPTNIVIYGALPNLPVLNPKS